MVSKSTRGRALSAAAVIGLAVGCIVLPATAASAAGTVTVTVQLVTVKGTAVGSTFDGTAVIDLHTAPENSATEVDEYWAPVADADAHPGETYGGPVSGGAVSMTIDAGSLVALTQQASDAYLSTSSEFDVNASVTKNVTVVKGASVSGHVTQPGKTGVLANAVVSALDSHGEVVATATTGPAGQYSLVALPSGSYRIQYNSHVSPATTASAKYTWNYYKGGTAWSTATAMTLHQQTSTSSATAKTNVNDVVRVGHTLTIKNQLPVTGTSYAHAELTLTNAHLGDSVNDQLDATGTSWKGRLVKGDYIVELFTDDFDHDYYWRGNGLAPTTSFSHAKKLKFADTANVTITFKS